MYAAFSAHLASFLTAFSRPQSPSLVPVSEYLVSRDLFLSPFGVFHLFYGISWGRYFYLIWSFESVDRWRETAALAAGLESVFRGFHSKISTTSTADRNSEGKLPGNGDTSATAKGFGRTLPDKDTAFPSFPGAKRDLWCTREKG